VREIESLFGDRVNSKDLWPTKFPGLTPSDFFLRGLQKGKVYTNKRCIVLDLKEDIGQETASFTVDLLQW
jgi:hypothetical protein